MKWIWIFSSEWISILNLCGIPYWRNLILVDKTDFSYERRNPYGCYEISYTYIVRIFLCSVWKNKSCIQFNILYKKCGCFPYWYFYLKNELFGWINQFVNFVLNFYGYYQKFSEFTTHPTVHDYVQAKKRDGWASSTHLLSPFSSVKMWPCVQKAWNFHRVMRQPIIQGWALMWRLITSGGREFYDETLILKVISVWLSFESRLWCNFIGSSFSIMDWITEHKEWIYGYIDSLKTVFFWCFFWNLGLKVTTIMVHLILFSLYEWQLHSDQLI